MAVREKGLATFSESGSTTILSNRVESVEHLPQNRANLQQAVDLRLDLRNSLYFLSEFDELHRCLREAESIAQRISDDRRLGRVINFLNSYYGIVGSTPFHRVGDAWPANQPRRCGAEYSDPLLLRALAFHHIGQYDQSIAFLRRLSQSHKRNASNMNGLARPMSYR